MIQTVKQNELARREYHILPAALMDAFDEGESHGSRQAIKTAWRFCTKDNAGNRLDRTGSRDTELEIRVVGYCSYTAAG